MARKIEWSEEARADVRSLDRPTAMRIFDGLYRYVQTGQGDVKALQGQYLGRLRLRIGDYRLQFTADEAAIRILSVKHRSEAYR